ncbi:odorant receptor 13a isoform X1 [Ooceraea biroi]|uniref:odorant receptor 13a isoform X1 n=1 Tax=Ooceraea biroi TaxID=2015173 RepID=UPI000F081EB4|nr:odorant receptor 13a isoform X1 [Ooceraea biroi]
MSVYNSRYYYLNKVLLSIVGLWPYQSRLEGNVMAIITLLFAGGYSGLELWSLIAGITDLSIIIENLSSTLINIMVIGKMVNNLYNNYKMKDLLDRIEETWKMIPTGPENEILRNFAEESRSFTIHYAMVLYAVWISFSMMPIVISRLYTFLPTNETFETKYLYRVEHVIDVEKYFTLLMLLAIIGIFYIVSIAIAVDSVFVLCMQHNTALFEEVRFNMERIRSLDCVQVEAQWMLKPNVANDEAYHIIIGCIKSYKDALNFFDVLASAYSTFFLLLLGMVVVCLSFSAAQLLLLDNQLDAIIRIVALNVAEVIHIYYLSLMSQQLIDYSSGIQEVIYNCDWYAISLRSRQLLKFTLLRVTKPCQITAGKMYVMSMENFGSIIKACLSYFTMLLSLR